MSPEERSSAKNGIWMCSDHGKAIDSTIRQFTVERLREWKKQAEERFVAARAAQRSGARPRMSHDDQLTRAFVLLPTADLAVFRQHGEMAVHVRRAYA